MKRKAKKKAFTIVELVIVIVVIAILAAVLIPTFAGLVEKTKLSADEQAVAAMNTALMADEVLGNKPETAEAAKNILSKAGFHMPAVPVTDGYRFYWIAADNRIALVKMQDDGTTPDTIVYPKELANKYATLPTDGAWFPLGGTGGDNPALVCEHENKDYIPVAFTEGVGSDEHIILCRDCNKSLGTEAHIDENSDNKCDKCEYIMPGGGEGDTHTHAYIYASNGDGTHTKTCGICGISSKDDCRFDSDNICALCGYTKPASGAHTHTFIYASNGDGTHTKTCTDNTCTDANNNNESCRYDQDNKCIYCGYERPEFALTGGILMLGGTPYTGINPSNVGENGLYYQEGLLYTGSAGGNSYKKGMLVVNSTTGAAGDDGTIYHYALENVGADFLTNKVILNTDSMSENIGGNVFERSGYGGYGFDITNSTGKRFVISSISADSIVGSRLKNGFTAAEIDALKEANALPKITKSTDFLAYLATIKDLNGGTTPTEAQYVELYKKGSLAGRTFTSYLKNKYGVAANGSLYDIYNSDVYFRNMVTDTSLHSFYPDTYWTDESFNGLIRGTTTKQYHVEPELIEFIFDIQYNHSIAFTFHKGKSSIDSNDTPDDIYALYYSINGGNNKIFKQTGANWIDKVNSSGDFTSYLYNYAALDNGTVPTDVFTTSADGNTISGSIWLWWHSYLAGNAYNGVDDDLPALEIILSVAE